MVAPVTPPVPAARVVFSASDRAEIARLIDGSLSSGSLTLGEMGATFERRFSELNRAPHAVAVASGTAALEIILRCLHVEGHEVVVPANTFFATAAAVVHAGATPRFADIDPDTFALTTASAAACLSPRTRAVIAVHIGGVISPEIGGLADLCGDRGIDLVEDAAHAHGSRLGGRPAGSWGRAAAWSFYPTKVVTSGEGGMITTADGEMAAEARIYRDQGKGSFLGGGHVRLGAAWRMSELHAAVGTVHLGRLDEFLAVRRAVAARYDAVSRIPSITVPKRDPDVSSNFYKYPVLLPSGADRAAVKRQMAAHGVVLAGEVYATPLHREPVFAPYAAGALPVAEDVCARQVCLPLHSDMAPDEVARVVSALEAVLG
jgi:perosamine synthetase